MAIFSGGWTLEAAEGVCDSDGAPCADVLDLLEHLVDQSLVVAELTPDDGVRYRLLETLPQYTHERLVAADEVGVIARQHARYFAEFAQEPEAALLGPRAADTLVRLEPERDNLRRALQWSLEYSESEWSLRLGSVLWQKIEYALSVEPLQPGSPSTAADAEWVSQLTERQGEVVVLIAQGLTNPQIAAELVITTATAERHVANILNRLGVKKRSQVAVWAVGHGLPVARRL